MKRSFFRNEYNEIKFLLPKYTESQIMYSLQISNGNINQSIDYLLSSLPPLIEKNILQWFIYFDPSNFGLDQQDIINSLELTYGNDIKELDFASSVKTMWPEEVPITIKMSREVFSDPNDGLGNGIAEYARHLAPIISDVNNIARLFSPPISRQLIYSTLITYKFDKYLTLKKLRTQNNNQTTTTTTNLNTYHLIPQTTSTIPTPTPIYQSTIVSQSSSSLSPPPPLPPLYHSIHTNNNNNNNNNTPLNQLNQPYQPNQPYQSNSTYQQFKCGQCFKLIQVPMNFNQSSTVKCRNCGSENIIPTSQLSSIPIVNSYPVNLQPQLQPQVTSNYSGYRPPSGITPAIPAPPMAPIHPYRSKTSRKALLIGINYTGQRGQLRGCCNDVREVYNLLTRTYGWSPSDFRILTDELLNLPNQLSNSNHRDNIPSKKNILDGLKWLTSDILPGDALFFHYSGHGAQQPDPEGIESDGMNETILPVDYNEAGMITDDEISSIIVQTLPDGVRLTCLMDSCHSGTGCDLPYTWNANIHKFEVEPNPYFSLGDVILFSGCQDGSTSCDVSSTLNAPGGAMTTAFVNTLKRNPFPTYDELLEGLLKEMKLNGFPQKPQMSSTQEFQIGRPFSLVEALPNTNENIGRTITRRFKSDNSKLNAAPLMALLLGGTVLTSMFF